MARTVTTKKKPAVRKKGAQDKVVMFGKRLGTSKKLIVSFSVDPWGVAASYGVPKQYLEALRQYEEKLLSASVRQLNSAIEKKGEIPHAAARKIPTAARTLAADRGWELRFVKVERTILGKKVLLGIRMVLNDKLCKDIVNAIAPQEDLMDYLVAVLSLAGVATGGTLGIVAAIAAVIVAAIKYQGDRISRVNKGKGVNYFMSYWVFLSGAALGPAGLITSWIGPAEN